MHNEVSYQFKPRNTPYFNSKQKEERYDDKEKQSQLSQCKKMKATYQVLVAELEC